MQPMPPMQRQKDSRPNPGPRNTERFPSAFWSLAITLLPCLYAIAVEPIAGAIVLLGSIPLIGMLLGIQWLKPAAHLSVPTLLVLGATQIYSSGNLVPVLVTVALAILYLFARSNPTLFQRRVVVWAPLLLLVALGAGFVLLDFTPPAWDQARHWGNVLRLLSIPESEQAAPLPDALFFYDFYPPLVYWAALPFSALFGRSYTAVALSVPLLWLPIGYAATYLFVRRVLRRRHTTAATVAFVLLGGWLVAGLSKQLMLDVPAFATIAAYHYALGRSGYLKHSRWTFVAGLIGGAALLTKPHTILYMAPVFIAALVRLTWRARRHSAALETCAHRLLLHALGFLAVAGPWYAAHMDFVRF